jgi:hypothetical protein
MKFIMEINRQAVQRQKKPCRFTHRSMEKCTREAEGVCGGKNVSPTQTSEVSI